MTNSFLANKDFSRGFVLIFGAVFFILIRYPNFILEPRLWAEESLYIETFISAENLIQGFDAMLYPAYYLLLSRLAGLISSLFDPSYIALSQTLFGLIILLIPIAIIAFTSSKYWDTFFKKIILIFFIIFSCSTGEVWLNSTNLGFIIPIASFLILINENDSSNLRSFFFCIIIFCAALTGPITLMMSPFFFLKFLFKRNKELFSYCLILFFCGIFQISYYYFSQNLGSGIANLNRGIFGANLNLLELFYYWIGPNILFPMIGYFGSLFLRNILLGLNLETINLDFLNFIFAPDQISFLAQIISENIWVISILNLAIFSIFIFFTYLLFRCIDKNEKIFVFSMFFYLSFLINLLSLGGHGGFRYSFLTSFMLLFLLFGVWLRNKNTFLKFLISFSIIIGVFEYYPRVISFSPDFSIENDLEWPNWSDEFSKWKDDKEYKPIIWPHYKESLPPFPDRSAEWSINLSQAESWEKSGRHLYSDQVKELLSINEK